MAHAFWFSKVVSFISSSSAARHPAPVRYDQFMRFGWKVLIPTVTGLDRRRRSPVTPSDDGSAYRRLMVAFVSPVADHFLVLRAGAPRSPGRGARATDLSRVRRAGGPARRWSPSPADARPGAGTEQRPGCNLNRSRTMPDVPLWSKPILDDVPRRCSARSSPSSTGGEGRVPRSRASRASPAQPAPGRP